ncbi:MAG TPA: hypothetical protein VFO65_04765 [Acidimicrobiales bacterium]|nr:hypothetical protein [Acidimicrobiales bacterium]
MAPELAALSDGGRLTCAAFGLRPEQLQVVVIAPRGDLDVVGVVAALEGPPAALG